MPTMTEQELSLWETRFADKIRELDPGIDPAHDLAHFNRVVKTAKMLAHEEKAKLEVVIPAAWLHDMVNVPKDDPRRAQASRLSAVEALKWLTQIGYPQEHHDEIRHAIEAHSFSAAIETRTVEASVVQDADRLDGLGAIGIARCFSVAGLLSRQIYHPADPFGRVRQLDDLEYTVDHFYVKLFRVARSLKTRAGREEGERRAVFMKNFLQQLGSEIGHPAAE